MTSSSSHIFNTYVMSHLENIQIHKNSFSVKLDDVASSPDDTVHHSCMQQLSCLVLSKRISGTAGRVLYTTVEQSSSSSIHIFNTYVMSHLVKYFHVSSRSVELLVKPATRHPALEHVLSWCRHCVTSRRTHLPWRARGRMHLLTGRVGCSAVRCSGSGPCTASSSASCTGRLL